MKKVALALAIIASSLVFTSNTNAQTKIGMFDREAVLSLMPGIQRVDSLMQKFVKDSLQTEYEMTYTEYNYKDSLLKGDTTAPKTLNASIKKVRIDEVNKLKAKLVGWQQYQQQEYQRKQAEYLQPFMEKIYHAMEEVIAEQKYTQIFKPDVFEYFELDKANEFNLRVLDKMKIPLPQQIEDQIKALKGGTKSATNAKPQTKPAGKN
ncbi:MAG: OmpH family outer membrane protein [Bacteroidetes bacterium]|nr:OmpH family outer membrane protein [Bacteroidota bacterium]MBS1648906.1 OmpH family outer membrane protein [Bacteroidota bacterium]